MSQVDVVGGLLMKDNRIFLQYRTNTERHANCWGIPGGRVEPDETPANAIMRELAEELGISITPDDNRRMDYRAAGNLRFAGYLLTSWQGDITNMEPDLCGEMGWFEYDKLPAPLTPGTRVLLQMYRAQTSVVTDRG